MKRGQFMWYAVVCLTGVCCFIWSVVWHEREKQLLEVSFLTVGQGDAIYIRSPSGAQMLIDGGPDASILQKLPQVMPWYAHSLDVLVATHPDLDHINGLTDVLTRYHVRLVLTSSVVSTSTPSRAFHRAREKNGAQQMVAQRGLVVNLGNGVFYEVLSPDRPVLGVDTNVGCVVGRLIYGSTSFLLSCDAPQSIERYLVTLDGHTLASNVLKAGHHGSKTSSLPLFIGFVHPQYLVFSRACDNSYGFPHPETIVTAKRFGIETLDTCHEGTVTFVSDGKVVMKK